MRSHVQLDILDLDVAALVHVRMEGSVNTQMEPVTALLDSMVLRVSYSVHKVYMVLVAR